MEKIKLQAQYLSNQERISLEALSSNIPIDQQVNRKVVSYNFIHPHIKFLPNERFNKTYASKKIAEIKQILSKSLFYKDKKKAQIQKQKLKTFLSGNKLDNLPISPQTEQKSSTKIKNNLLGCKDVEKMLNCEVPFEDSSLARYSQDLYFNSVQENQHYSTDHFFDQKFNQLLELNLATEQDNLSLDIDSRFATKKDIKAKQEVYFLETQAPENRMAIHQKLLEQQNLYIREQLMFFRNLIQEEREATASYHQQLKISKKEVTKLKLDLNKAQKQIEKREQAISFFENLNEELQRNLASSHKEKASLIARLESLSKDYELAVAKLTQLQEQKEKQIQRIVQKCGKQKQSYFEQMSEKDRDILELNEFIEALKAKIKFLQKLNTDSQRQNINLCSDNDRVRQQQEVFEIQEEFQRSSSICLSLVEAQNIKNIIQEKEQLFQQEIESLKKIAEENSTKYSRNVEELQNKLTLLEKQKQEQIIEIKNNYNKQLEQLRVENSQRFSQLKKQLSAQQQKNLLLRNQIQGLDKRAQENSAVEDQQLEQLLQNCVNELQREKNVNYILHQQASQEKKANYLLRTQIEHLKKLFTKQLCVIQEIQNRSYIN